MASPSRRRSGMWTGRNALALLLVVVVMVLMSSSHAEASPRRWKKRPLPPIFDGAKEANTLNTARCGDGPACASWIIKFKDHVVQNAPETLEKFCLEAVDVFSEGKGRKSRKRFSGKCMRRLNRFGFIKFASDDDAQINEIRKAFRDELAYVERDLEVHAYRNTKLWNLDRIDTRERSFDSRFRLADRVSGANVHVYVIDTGIAKNHTEFAGRVAEGYDFVDDDDDPEDCDGHGTHCAGTAVGSRYGVASQAILHGVRVLSCRGAGSHSNVLAGMEWVADNHDTLHPDTRAVVSLSLGGGFSAALDDGVTKLVEAGVVVVAAAGNSNRDSCLSSPASSRGAITVGATSSTDARASFSNYGECVDIYAPGVNIMSATIGNTTNAATSLSGTSMATPLVAGAAALYLQVSPEAPADSIVRTLLADATTDVVSDGRQSTPSKLLFTGNIEHCDPVEDEPIVDCVVGPWSRWSACDRACGGGFQLRSREVLSGSRNCGLCNEPLHESQACNTATCTVDREMFQTNRGRAFDLANTVLTYAPSSDTTYSTCRSSIEGLPFDPDTDGEEEANVSLGDDTFVEVKFAFKYFGKRYDSVFVGSNGYVTLNAGARDFLPQLQAGKTLPRISGFYTDLYANGPASVRVNRVNETTAEGEQKESLVVTYNLRTYSQRKSTDDASLIKFQIILGAGGTEGDVTIAHIGSTAAKISNATHALVGLQSGGKDSAEVDLSEKRTCLLDPPTPPPPSPPPPPPPSPPPPPPPSPPPPPPPSPRPPPPKKKKPSPAFVRNTLTRFNKLLSYYASSNNAGNKSNTKR